MNMVANEQDSSPAATAAAQGSHTAPAGPAFVHLRVHSEYSIVDGLVRIDDLISAAAKDKQAALAMADLSNMFGMVKFYKAARGKGIKPVIGVDRSEEHTSELQSHHDLVCGLLLEKKKKNNHRNGDEQSDLQQKTSDEHYVRW